MVEAPVPLVAIVGFKRSKAALLGGVRILVVRDGTVRLLGKKNRVDLDAPVHTLTARLTRTRVVQVRSATTLSIVYGLSEMTRLTKDLQAIVLREGHDAVQQSEDAEFIGPVPAGMVPAMSPRHVIGLAQAGRAIADGLHTRGVREG